MWVFPGGQVDTADGLADLGELGAAGRAAVREAREEAGLILDESDLVPLSHWLPPRQAPRRFATWFFVVSTIDQDVVIDGTEVRQHQWFAPAAAISARNDGTIELAPPTFTTLWWLRDFARADEAVVAAASRQPERFETRVVLDPGGGLRATLWAGDAAYEGGDIEVPGPRRRLVMESTAWRVELEGT
jgi:8-oxo-dGTP pyrophosphatase MutT (NUDIX family)